MTRETSAGSGDGVAWGVAHGVMKGGIVAVGVPATACDGTDHGCDGAGGEGAPWVAVAVGVRTTTVVVVSAVGDLIPWGTRVALLVTMKRMAVGVTVLAATVACGVAVGRSTTGNPLASPRSSTNAAFTHPKASLCGTSICHQVAARLRASTLACSPWVRCPTRG